jgi:DNA-binding response OmpR family regulator
MKKLILLVDDDQEFRETMAMNLSRLGFAVRQADEGDYALNLYENRGPYHFVLSDWKFFPGEIIKNGVDLCHAIRELNPQQALAIHTAEPEACKQTFSNLLSGVPLIKKPYRIKALESLIGKP